VIDQDKHASPAERSIGPENDVEALLPWYAAGTASDAQRSLVERALAADAALRDQLELIAEEMHAARIANEQAGHAPANALARLMETIERASPSLPYRDASKRRAGPLNQVLEWLGRPKHLAPLALAGILLLLGQAAFIATLLGRTAENSIASVGANAATGSTVMIGFAAGATSAEIDAFLAREHLRIVDGPLPGGLYNVQLSNATLAVAERDAALAKLRSLSTLVRSAQPSR
jgi:hypothetical protein